MKQLLHKTLFALVILSLFLASGFDDTQISAQGAGIFSEYNSIITINRGGATALAYSPVAGRILVATPTGTWLHTQALDSITSINTISPSVGAMDWSDNGAYIALANQETVQIWDYEGQQEFTNFTIRAFIDSPKLEWSPDSTKLAVVTDNSTIVFDLGINGIITTLPVSSASIIDLEWGPNSIDLALSGQSEVQIWNISDESMLTVSSSGLPYGLSWNLDTNELAIPSINEIKIWSGTSLQVENIIVTLPGTVSLVSWVGNRLLSVEIGNTLRLRDTVNGIPETLLNDILISQILALDSDIILLRLQSGIIKKVELEPSLSTENLPYYSGYVRGLTWASSDLVTVGANNFTAIWNLETGFLTAPFDETDDIYATDATQSGNYIAFGGENGLIRIWNRIDDSVLNLNGHITNVNTLSISPNGEYLVSGDSDGIVNLWATSNGNLLQSYSQNNGIVSVAWNLLGDYFAVSDRDKNVVIWQVGSSQPYRTFSFSRIVQSLDWGTSEQNLVLTDLSTTTIWDVATANPLINLENGENIRKVIWRDHSHIYGITTDNMLVAWDTSSGSQNGQMLLPYTTPISFEINPADNAIGLFYASGITQILSASSSVTPTITNFGLIDLDTNMYIESFNPIINGAEIQLSSLPTTNLGIRVNTSPEIVGSVVISLNGAISTQIDNSSSYELTNWLPIPGNYTVTAVPYTGPDSSGLNGDPATVNFNISQENSCTHIISGSVATDLVTAIGEANNEPTPQTLCLEGTYELTNSNNSSSDGANGLPVITGDITLMGINGGATITRQGGSPEFRIAKVDTDGRLVLNGITISNGLVSNLNSGGGIRNRGTLEVINSVITNNQSDSGGGIRNNDNATLIITNSTISNNTSTSSGGGVYSNTGSTTTITDSVFTNNHANHSSGHGGGLYMNGASLTITGADSSFDNNHAFNGGGIFVNVVTGTNPAQLTDVSITNNTSYNHGGGIYISTGNVALNNVNIAANNATNIGGGIRNGANLTIQNSVLESNNGGDTQGGAISNYGSLVLDDTDLIGNYGASATLRGGAVYNEGTLTILNGSLLDGTSTTVSINARHGGGLYAESGTIEMSDSQILNNVATVDGGGIHIRSSAAVNASGVIVDNNTANDDGGGVYNEGVFTFRNGGLRTNHAADQGGGVYTQTATNNFIHYSCIEGNTAANRTGVYSGASNFDATNNWWGSTSGATSTQVNSNVVKTLFVNTSCLDAQAMGGGALAATQSSSTTTTTIETVSAPYETIFDERDSWLRSGTWVQEANGGRASTGWVVDATIRNMISTLEMPLFVNLGSNPSPRVRYWQRGVLSNNDMIVLEILPEGATTWTILDQQSNFNSDWTQRDIDLSAYRGQAIRLRWRLTTAGDVPTGQSSIDYAIDDLQITSRR